MDDGKGGWPYNGSERWGGEIMELEEFESPDEGEDGEDGGWAWSGSEYWSDLLELEEYESTDEEASEAGTAELEENMTGDRDHNEETKDVEAGIEDPMDLDCPPPHTPRGE